MVFVTVSNSEQLLLLVLCTTEEKERIIHTNVIYSHLQLYSPETHEIGLLQNEAPDLICQQQIHPKELT